MIFRQPFRLCPGRSNSSTSSIATRRLAVFTVISKLAPLGSETVGLAQALGRILAQTVVAGVDVPGFDRSSVDGFAVHADDTVGASDRAPRTLTLNSEILTPGTEPQLPVTRGTATLIATGGMVPRGADAVVMVEHTEAYDRDGTTLIEVRRPAAPGQFIAFAGSDLARGETVLRAGQMLTSREIGMLAAVGCAAIEVWRKPRVAIISTGDEIIAPGEAMRPGAVYDSNAAILAAAVEEAGGMPQLLGIGPDDEEVLSRLVGQGLASCDMVILSGGTSKGAGDLCYRAIADFHDPGIVVHGVALKPGKPLCLAVTGGKPIVILPGFPTSAIFTFHEFVAPVIRAFAGLSAERTESLPSDLAAACLVRARPHRVSDGLPRARRRGRRTRRLSQRQGLRCRHCLQPSRRVHLDRPACRERFRREPRSRCS